MSGMQSTETIGHLPSMQPINQQSIQPNGQLINQQPPIQSANPQISQINVQTPNQQDQTMSIQQSNQTSNQPSQMTSQSSVQTVNQHVTQPIQQSNSQPISRSVIQPIPQARGLTLFALNAPVAASVLSQQSRDLTSLDGLMQPLQIGTHRPITFQIANEPINQATTQPQPNQSSNQSNSQTTHATSNGTGDTQAPNASVSQSSQSPSPAPSSNQTTNQPNNQPPSQPSVHAVQLSLPSLTNQQQIVRSLINQLFVLKTDVMEIFDRWAQLPALSQANNQSNNQSAQPTQLLAKLVQKEKSIRETFQSINQAISQSGIDRYERGKKNGQKPLRSIMGYESINQSNNPSKPRDPLMLNLVHQSIKQSLPLPSDQSTNRSNLITLQSIYQSAGVARHSINQELSMRFPAVLHQQHAISRLISIDQSLKQSLKQSNTQSNTQSNNQPVNEANLHLSINEIIQNALAYYHRGDGPEKSSINQLINQSNGAIKSLIVAIPSVIRFHIKLSVNHSSNPSTKQSNNQTNKQSINQSNTPLITRIWSYSWLEEKLCTRGVRPSDQSINQTISAQLMEIANYHQSTNRSIKSNRASRTDPDLIALHAVLSHLYYYVSLTQSPCQQCGKMLDQSINQSNNQSILSLPVVRTVDHGRPLHVECVDAYQARIDTGEAYAFQAEQQK